MAYVIQVLVTACEQDQDDTALILIVSCQQNLYDICHCCVYSEKTYAIAVFTVKNS